MLCVHTWTRNVRTYGRGKCRNVCSSIKQQRQQWDHEGLLDHITAYCGNYFGLLTLFLPALYPGPTLFFPFPRSGWSVKRKTKEPGNKVVLVVVSCWFILFYKFLTNKTDVLSLFIYFSPHQVLQSYEFSYLLINKVLIRTEGMLLLKASFVSQQLNAVTRITTVSGIPLMD